MSNGAGSRFRKPIDSKEEILGILKKRIGRSNEYDEKGQPFYFKQADAAGETVFKATKGLETEVFQPLGGLQMTSQIYELFTSNTNLDYKEYDRIEIPAFNKSFTIDKVIKVTSSSAILGGKRYQNIIKLKTQVKLRLK
jgi:hypothetical protein